MGSNSNRLSSIGTQRKLHRSLTLRHKRNNKLYAMLGIMVSIGIVSSVLVLRASAASYTWDGGGGDNNWTTCTNWTTDTCPIATDSVTFDGTSTKNATIDASFQGTIANITVSAGYTGTITASRDFTVTTAFAQSAGTFIAPSTTLTLNGNLTVNPGGTFDANGGTVKLIGNNTVTGNVTFYNLNKLYGTTWGTTNLTVQAGSTQTVMGDLLVKGRGISYLLNLKSTTPGTIWSLDVHGIATADRLTIADVNNISLNPITATNTTSVVNSTGWIALPPTQPNGYAASDMLGQIDGNGQPIWGQSDEYNGEVNPNDKGFDYPNGTELDVNNHRLFVSDCSGKRIMVFDLDSNNNLTDRIADYVLGQPNFTTNAPAVLQNSVDCPGSTSYDPVHDRLFVLDHGNSRVLVFDLSNGITNGMNASYVLGQPDFITKLQTTTQSGMNKPWSGSAYDTATDYFYVGDFSNRRVLVFDLSNGITNGMNASYVIGQQDFTSSVAAITQTGITYPYSLDIDTDQHRLFLGDYNGANRVLVYDISISNLQAYPQGMPATNVLGQLDFTSALSRAPTKSAISDPDDIVYDPIRQRLFAQDDWNNRVMVFDLHNGITNNMEAMAVIGQESFTEDQWDCLAWQTDQCDAEGLSDAFDILNNRLWLSDSSNNRILMFNFVTLTTPSLPNGVTGAPYSNSVSSQNSQGTVSYRVSAGSLPPGLVLGANGVISGTPTTDGTYTFTIEVKDDNGSFGYFTDWKEYTMQTLTDSDGDSIADVTEIAGPLGNDVNNDAINDNLQPIVTTSFNSIANAYTTTVVNNCVNGFTRFANIASSELPKQDTNYAYPLGLQDFSVDCGVVGTTATFTQYLDKVYDTTTWKYRKFIPSKGYLDITDKVVLGTAIVNGIKVTTVAFSVTDGSVYDADGIANGFITDPLGVAVASSELANTGLDTMTMALLAISMLSVSAVSALAITRRYS